MYVCMHMLGCNNGGGGRMFSKVKRLFAKCVGTRKWLFSGFWPHSGILQTQELFPKAYFTHKPIYACLTLFRDLRICKNIGIRTCFVSVTAESVRVFHYFPFGIKVPRLATFFIASKNRIF